MLLALQESHANNQAAVKELRNSVPADRNGTFASLKALLRGLRANFGAIPHTGELVGLRSANGVHRRTVDVHTLEVVENLRGLTGFEALSPSDRDVVELAAYLHDIGKGPKERWDDTGGLQKVDPDHPIRAMPMLVEILTQHVQNWDLAAAKDFA